MNKNKTIKIKKPVQIFSNKGNFNEISVIKSQIKITILEMLKSEDMAFDDIVKNTGKSKSTISVHLKELRNQGLVSFKQHSEDNRRKTFYLTSNFLGSVDFSESDPLEENNQEFLIDKFINGQDINMFFLLFHSIKATLIQKGINIDPILYDVGINIGNAIFHTLYDENFDKFLGNIAAFWEEKGLGKISADTGKLIKITSVDCWECEHLPKTGKPSCYVDLGIMESLFTSFFGFEVNIIEVQCYTMGDGQCVFEIEPKPKV